MKRVLSVIALALLSFGFAQSEIEANVINFYPDVKKSAKLSQSGYQLLVTNINRILLESSQGATDRKHFVLYGIPNIFEEHIIPTVPPIHKVLLEVQLVVGDVSEKRTYGSYTYTHLVGVNRNKDRAILQALRSLKTNTEVQKFLRDSKKKIFDYYKNNCNVLITRASVLAELGKYMEAIEKLDAVPNVSEDCFYMAQSKITEIAKIQNQNTRAKDRQRPNEDTKSGDSKEDKYSWIESEK
ncbi:hypothetical protein ElyMa_002236700 [Elysia marginata]|uniref:Tetratricopeptide repeat protein n=1 Tax=Elysia marginata TaxID=1093978 RepID=A0AAV4FVU5_9GAST|nr:hypothetical protein ElyMa_002236700 [Elysia marginata]